MPEYNYKCTQCSIVFKKEHGMSEKLEQCPSCEEMGTLKRLPSNFLTNNKKLVEKTGNIVKRSIEEIRQELAQEKKALKEEYYE